MECMWDLMEKSSVAKTISKNCLCEEMKLEISELKTRLTVSNEANFEQSISRPDISTNHDCVSVGRIDQFHGENTVSNSYSLDTDKYKRESDLKYLNRIIECKDSIIDESKDKISILKKYTKLMENSGSNSKAPYMNHDRYDQQTEKEGGLPDVMEMPTLKTRKGFKLVPAKKKLVINTENFLNSKLIERFSNGNNKNGPNSNSQNSKSRMDGGSTTRRDVAVTETGMDSSTFSGAPKRAWVYVGRVGDKVQEGQIEEHLKGKFLGKHFLIDKLPDREGARNSAFRVGADMSLLENLYKPENWPLGVMVERFGFFREKNNKE